MLLLEKGEHIYMETRKNFIKEFVELVGADKDIRDNRVEDLISAFKMCVTQTKYEPVPVLYLKEDGKSKDDKVLIDKDISDLFNTLTLRKDMNKFVISFVRFLTDIKELPQGMQNYINKKRPKLKTKKGTFEPKKEEAYTFEESKYMATLEYDLLMAYNLLVASLVRESTHDLGLVMYYNTSGTKENNRKFDSYLRLLYGEHYSDNFILDETLNYLDANCVLVPNNPTEFFKRNGKSVNFKISNLLIAFITNKKVFSKTNFCSLEKVNEHMRLRQLTRLTKETMNEATKQADKQYEEELGEYKTYFCHNADGDKFVILIKYGRSDKNAVELDKALSKKISNPKYNTPIKWRNKETNEETDLWVDSSGSYIDEFGVLNIWCSDIAYFEKQSNALLIGFEETPNGKHKKTLIRLYSINMMPIYSSAGSYMDSTQSIIVPSVFDKVVLQPKDAYSRNRHSTLNGQEQFVEFSSLADTSLADTSIEYLFSCVLNHLLWYKHFNLGTNVLSVFDTHATVYQAKEKFNYVLPSIPCNITYMQIDRERSAVAKNGLVSEYALGYTSYDAIVNNMDKILETYGYTDDKESFMDKVTSFISAYDISMNIGNKEVVPIDVENVEEEGEENV